MSDTNQRCAFCGQFGGTNPHEAEKHGRFYGIAVSMYVDENVNGKKESRRAAKIDAKNRVVELIRASGRNPDEYEFSPCEPEWVSMISNGVMAYGMAFRADERVVQPHSKRERSA